ncbi:MAG: PDZ domain-containing protein [Firmicutes bacterium]|nr:PDZ domain-containing protein [Bacillota bacterium]
MEQSERVVGRRRRWRGPLLSVASSLLALALIVLYFIPLPYYIFLPGEAMNLQPIVTVSGGHKSEKGAFMLTTVSVLYAQNVYDYLYGILQPDHQVYTAQEMSGGLSDRQYNDVETYMMQSAHQDAEIAALRFMHKPYHVAVRGVEVVSINGNSPARAYLHLGDVITAIDGHSLIHNPDALYTVLAKKKVGQRIDLSYLRQGTGVARTVSIPLIALPPEPGQKGTHAGIGLLPALAISVSSPVKIAFHTGDIEGPSAGLMFTLEIISQLYPGDLSRGYRIAGTGTISPTGQVGQIGGATHKVDDANAAGAEIFFVPQDEAPGDTNSAHALAEAKRIGTHMRVVPVRTLAQAVHYLLSLPEKGH